jgi:hypothetical protein
MGPRAGLDTEARGKIIFASAGYRASIVQSEARHYTDTATPATRERKCQYEIQEQKKCRYVIPAYTGKFEYCFHDMNTELHLQTEVRAFSSDYTPVLNLISVLRIWVTYRFGSGGFALSPPSTSSSSSSLFSSSSASL